ncbi:RNA polymerase sigma factor [Defluviimonas sp. WL0002]|uniref:RNA polymerase sigma factor n=1 Tax=Albidovulum marisflavi TaxID=2984159 RepID=A0ABT2ZCF9_9RHOB|nr:RNA polymerase sigma factor [Defluviimonas sp. WL0002]MCV2868794.1 RNA polymerase sigma factor [Defluviimonas sp. WL0002]
MATTSCVRADCADDDLLRLYGAGDPAAVRMLTDRLAPLAYRVALRMLGDAFEAEDIAQEAMLRLWRAAPGWQSGGAKVSTWLYRVVANLATDRLRRRRAAPLADAPDVADGQQSALAALVERDRAAALNEALLRLPERQRQAVVLRHLEGLGNPEIAEIMEVGVEAVESLTARGRRALAAALSGRREGLGYEEG